MKRTETAVIIGGGIAGLTAAYVLKEHKIDALVLEREGQPGGLCRSFQMDGEWFDLGGHVTFAKDPFVRELLEAGVEYNQTQAIIGNYKKGKWIKHPVQNNLAVLDTEEKIKIIEDFVNRPNNDTPRDYAEWLYSKYGRYFTDNYPRLYTRKYWTVEPEEMGTEWIGQRMYTPTLREVLRGAFEKETPYVHYSGTSRYPVDGGFEHFIKRLEESARVECRSEIVEIDAAERMLRLSNGDEIAYNFLISTAPLPELVLLFKGASDKLKEAAGELYATSVVLVSMAIRGKKPAHWNYFYDEEVPAARAYCTNRFTGKFSGLSAVQAEVYYSRFRPFDGDLEGVKRETVERLDEIGYIDKEKIVSLDARYLPYGNVIITKDTARNRRIVHDYLDEKGVLYAGRFGEWDYLWTDQSMLSGKRAAEQAIAVCVGESALG